MARRPQSEQFLGAIEHLPAICLGLMLFCLASCQTQPEQRVAELHASRDLPRAAAVANAIRYEILPERSDIRFLVYRAGALARLGHNHVVQAKGIRGEIFLAPDVRQSQFSISLPVNAFQVDAEAARMEEGGEFRPMPDAEAIAGTTRNMLGEQVLDAANYPTVEISSVASTGPDWGLDVTARIRMHGVEREILIPAAIEYQRDTLVVTAMFSVKQSDFGIVPMRVLGGALQVDDLVRVRMRVVAGKRELQPMPSATD
ncbi:MAG: YceI family protein [Propionivibrio sp.]